MSTASGEPTVLVTGGTGFIGRHLVNALAKSNENVRVLSRGEPKPSGFWGQYKIDHVVGDITSSKSIENFCAGVQTVFHLANNIEDSPLTASGAVRANVTVYGTRRLLDACLKTGVKKFIFASSVKAMGEGDVLCLDESSLTAPVTPYGKAKLDAENQVLAAGSQHGMHVSVLRFPLVYGRDNRGNIWRMIGAIDRGRFPPLPDSGNRRSIIHVEDSIQALRLAAENTAAAGKTYIVTDDNFYSTRQIYVTIQRALGRTIPRWAIPLITLRLAASIGDAIKSVSGKDFIFNSNVLHKLTGSAQYSCRRIMKEIGYRPTKLLEDGVREMVDQYLLVRKAR